MLSYEKEFTNEKGEFQYYRTPMKAIRAKCLHDCCCGSVKEVRDCAATKCFLWPFRMGHRPKSFGPSKSEE